MDNHELFINKIIQKINEAANSNMGITLSADEVKELNKEIGDQFFIPVLSMEQVGQLVKEGKLGQQIKGKE